MVKKIKELNAEAKLSKRGRPAISREKRQEMREKIAIATQQLFQAEGYRQISMRRIAREVGCSAMTLYKYYDSKLEILYTLWEDVFESIFDRINALEISEETPRKQLILLSSAYLNYWLENTEHYRLVYMTEGIKQLDVSTFVENPRVIDHYQVFAQAIEKTSSATLSNDELVQKLNTMICFLQGIAHNHITISGYDWPSIEYLVDAAVKGVVD